MTSFEFPNNFVQQDAKLGNFASFSRTEERSNLERFETKILWNNIISYLIVTDASDVFLVVIGLHTTEAHENAILLIELFVDLPRTFHWQVYLWWQTEKKIH